MFGWRARIGYACAGAQAATEDRAQALPEGVVFVYATQDVHTLGPSEFERVLEKFYTAAEYLAEVFKVQYIILSGSAVFDHQYNKSLELAKRAQEVTGIPTIINTTAHINALKTVGAKKVVVISPMRKECSEDRARILRAEGMEVVNMKELGLKTIGEFNCAPPYASYQLAMEAIRETPEADTINIICPAWSVLSTIELLERDSGKVVVFSTTAEIYEVCKALQIKGPINGYGKLLEML